MSQPSKRARDAIKLLPKPEPEIQAKVDLTKMPVAQGEIPATGRVIVMRDHGLDFPELYLDVFVTEGAEKDFGMMLGRSRCRLVDNPDDADVVFFVGGADVDPQLYGEKLHPLTRFNADRDSRDMELYAKCLEEGIPMVGICRGAQFLHVMNGGKLYQHVVGHQGDHSAYDPINSSVVPRISSTHHQMCIENNRMRILLKAFSSTERWLSPSAVDKTKRHPDVEAFFYEETCCLGIQGHPEFANYNQYTVWALKAIQDYIAHNVNLVATPVVNTGRTVYRLKKEFVLEREANTTKEAE